MGIELVTAGYGPESARALHHAVATRKTGSVPEPSSVPEPTTDARQDALAPVTVVVPTNYVGVTARRLLASGALGPVVRGTAGVAGVTFLTVYRLAELLGAPMLAAAGRRPVSTPVLAAGIRQVLARRPGMFAPVAEHPATEQALVEAYRELSQCGDPALDAVARTGSRASDVVRITRAVRLVLERDWYDERDLMDAAVAAVERGAPVVADLGTVVLYLPQEVSEHAARLLRSVAERIHVVVIAGCTGVPRADAAVRASVARLEVDADDTAWSTTPPIGTEVVSASDPDDEVRAAVRMIFAALREGVPLERMAILYGSPEPYARLVHEQLDAAGVPHNGAAVRTLAQSVLGASFLALLALPDRDFHRHDVMALLSSAPVHQIDGRAVPSARWERLSRNAGVVRGVTQWVERLDREIERLQFRLDEELAVPDREPRPERFERDLSAARDLRAFIEGLHAELEAGNAPGASWRTLATWAQSLIDRRLAGARRREHWPEVEQQAAEKIDAALERLAGLETVEGSPGLEVFRRTLALELDADLGRVGRLGDGILMGHLALGLGLDLDRVFVCGLAEGTLPARVRDDSLLPDADRRAANGELTLRAARVDTDHRMYLAALAATSGPRVLLFPRGDLRRTTERMPSRFLLDTVERLAGTRLYADELSTLAQPWFAAVPSFASGIAHVEFPATAQEHRLRTLLDHTRDGNAVHAHALTDTDLALHRGIDCAVARASSAFTRFDGNLASMTVPTPARDDVVVSPTRLEAWARRPFDYLMDQVLRVEIPELPEEVYELSPLDRGSLVHEILDEFLRDVLERDGGAPDPGTPWVAADRSRLHEIAEKHCARYAAMGVTGRRVFWDRDRRRIMADLDLFLVYDAEARAEHGWSPVATELRFGLPGAQHPAVEIALSDGRSLRFRGAADRVDRGPDGALSVVDYKTGRPWGFDADDPLAAGTHLQLPVYARAARAAYGSADTPVRAAYWFVSTKGGFRWSELELTPEVEGAFDKVLRAIVDGIEHGQFPCPVDPPDSWSWRERSYVDPDARGTRDRYREWERKCGAPELASFLALSERGDETGEGG